MQRFGQYDVQSSIGRVGMGEVYLAHDPRRERDAASTLLPDGARAYVSVVDLAAPFEGRLLR